MFIQTHPHPPFIPPNLKKLIMGSFPGRPETLSTDPDNNWFYSAKRNQLWKILEIVFEQALPDQETKARVLSANAIGLADILLQVQRLKPTNQDQDLRIITYNDQAIGQILQRFPTATICFTSLFVEKQFKHCFPDYKNTKRLPSPSPRYAKMSLKKKAAVYKEILLCP